MKILTIYPQKIFISFFIFLIFNSCTAVKPLTSASHFRFYLDDEPYRIRSITSVDKGNSYNELIGTGFVAMDFDKDRILDKVMLGECQLAKAQKIYEYGLNILLEKDKLMVYSVDIIDYVQVNSDYDYQIKSFHPEGSEPFNEFKIIRKHEISDVEIVLIDHSADGILDEVLKGPVEEVTDYQARYAYVLNVGLEKDRLVKKGDKILVREE